MQGSKNELPEETDLTEDVHFSSLGSLSYRNSFLCMQSGLEGFARPTLILLGNEMRWTNGILGL
jgi:hypothetical protein